MGLYLYPENGTYFNGWHFEQDETYDGDPLPFDPVYNRSPDSVSGTPQDDIITFSFNKYLYFSVHAWWEPFLAYGVKQRRILSGELVLEVERGAAGGIIRACWDVIDRRTGVCFVETATGVISATAELLPRTEQWTLTLHRGDKLLLPDGTLEASTRGCGGA